MIVGWKGMRVAGPGTYGGLITEGWALVHYKDTPILLMGKGEHLAACFFKSPFRVTKLGPLEIQATEEEVVEDFLPIFARQAVRITMSALARTADFLLAVAERTGPTPRGHWAFEIPLCQQQFGDLLGLSCVHLNRTLQKMQKQNLIRYGDRRYEILDMTGLAGLASDL